MNKEQLYRFISGSTGNESNICQIHVIKDGRMVYDDCWHGFTAGDAVNVNSVTKGIMGLLAGIALDKGCIRSIDQKVMEFFPDYSGGRKGITGEFRYATLGIQILAGIIERASKEKCIDFANRNLFEPLGLPKRISHGDSSKEDQFDFLMNKNPRKYEWYSDPQNTVTAGWGLCMSAREMAVVGELVLNNGMYNGNRIISAEYIHDMLRPYLKLGERFGYMNYGYLWYKPFDDREVYAAIVKI